MFVLDSSKARSGLAISKSEIRNIITPIKRSVDRSGVFNPCGSKNRGVPLTRQVALTTVLQYRADCDRSSHVL